MSVAAFTLAHFREWASRLELDNGERWKLEPFQEAFVADVFGGKPVCWLVIPQGNGKTTLVGGLALYWIEHQRAARVFVAAATREQATDACFAQMAAFVVNSGLEGLFTCQEGHRRVLCKAMNSRVQIRAADERTSDGAIPTFVILDELHRHRDLGLYRTIRGKLKKRNAQMVVISTAGEPGAEFEEQRERMRQMADVVEREETFTRAVGESYVLHDWAVAEDGDSDDLELVARANPLSQVTVEVLREERESPDWNLGHWRRLTCNLPTRSEMAAITEDEWFGAQVEERIPDGARVSVGLDVGWKYDTTAAVPLWIRDDQFRLFDRVKILTPPRNGQQLDHHLVEHALIEIHDRNPIDLLVMDTSDAEYLATWAEEELGCTVVDRGQSNSLAVEDYNRFMEALRLGWLRHTGDREFSRHVLNAIARPATYGDLRFDRPSSSRRDALKQDRRVIDALTAAAMVHTAATFDLAVGDALVAFG